jgi:hypothetical protein
MHVTSLSPLGAILGNVAISAIALVFALTAPASAEFIRQRFWWSILWTSAMVLYACQIPLAAKLVTDASPALFRFAFLVPNDVETLAMVMIFLHRSMRRFRERKFLAAALLLAIVTWAIQLSLSTVAISRIASVGAPLALAWALRGENITSSLLLVSYGLMNFPAEQLTDAPEQLWKELILLLMASKISMIAVMYKSLGIKSSVAEEI